ncbi:methionyl-tRNA formyltransferase [Candidatus Pelagibacter sp. Uisw_127]|uniref:methionyl-tRNA formyltransferase n=1 Tax=Candidatus Pelagibacter sp. Uisw_127 TaxID=3230988 RepID=UPI0039EBADE2
MLKKIVFMGTPLFAVSILKSLYQNGYSVSVVYTQPPQKSQRGQKINKSPVQGISETLKIEYRTPSSLKNNTEEYNYLKKLNADIAIVVAYGQIIPKEYLSLVKKGFINIHASLLPKWRGAAPIQRSIMNLEKETGISVMRIEEKLDSGPICNSYKIEIMTDDNSETISEKLSTIAAEKILDNIDNILDDKIEFKEQNHNEASYAAKIEKTEGQIEWGETAESIIGKINGLYPSPGAFFTYNGERYKILKASLALGRGKIGEVLDNYLEISCGNKKSIKVLEIQRQGKRPQNISEFMLGSQIKKGSKLSNA